MSEIVGEHALEVVDQRLRPTGELVDPELVVGQPGDDLRAVQVVGERDRPDAEA